MARSHQKKKRIGEVKRKNEVDQAHPLDDEFGITIDVTHVQVDNNDNMQNGFP